ncbi:MAG: DUF167 domain-containing protein [Lentisphaerae bacterium]|nr:DUF167 domain-containing protein [Lentisphaerota bacterium]
MPALVPTTGGSLLTVKVQPRAAADAIAGVAPDWVRIRLRAPPVDGKANAALSAFLAQSLGLPARTVTILSGATGRLKRVRIAGLAPDAVRRILALGAPAP